MPYVPASAINSGDFIFVVLSKLYALEFEQHGAKYRCDGHDTIYVFSGNKGILMLADWAGRACGGKKGAYSAWGLLMEYFGDTEVGKESARAFFLDNGGDNYAARAVESKPTEKIQRPKPVTEQAEKNSYHYEGARKWLEQKTGFPASREMVGLSCLRAFSVNEGKWVRFGVDRAGEQNYGILYSCAGTDSMKIRQTGKGVPSKFKSRMHMDQSPSAAPYIFGFDALPATGDTLFLLEGETDVCCWRAHCDVPAMTTGGALMPIPVSVGRALSLRFRRIVIMYDGDAAGLRGARRMGETHGWEVVNAARLYAYGSPIIRDTHAAMVDKTSDADKAKGDFKGADLCDIYGAGGAVAIKEVIYAAQNWGQWDSKSIVRHTFAEYLPASPVAMHHLMMAAKLHKVVSLSAPAGTGKTTAVAKLSEELGRTIFCVPTITIAEQQHKALTRAGIPCAPIYGGVQKFDTEAAEGSTLTVCTYDALRHIQHLFADSTLIIDESHQVVSEYSYRRNALDGVMYAAAHAKRTMLFSATPNALLDGFLGAKKLHFVAKKTNKIKLSVCIGKANKNVIFEAIVEEKKPGATTIIKMDNLKRLQNFAEYATKAGFTCDVFTSKKDAHKRNDNYAQIVDNGKFAARPDFLLCTTILEAGVSILDEIDAIHIFDKFAAQKIVQMATRPRMNGDKNKEIRVFVYPSKGDDGGQCSDGYTFEERQQHAENNKARFVFLHDGEHGGEHISSDAAFHIEHDKGTYFVNSLSILHDMDKQQPRDAQSIIESVMAIDARFECETIDVASRGGAELSRIAREKKAEMEAAQHALQAAIAICSDTTMQIYARHIAHENRKDKTLIEAIKSAVGVEPPKRIEVESFEAEIAELGMLCPALFSDKLDNAHLIRAVVFFAPILGTHSAFVRAAQITPAQLRLEQDRANAALRKKAVRNKEANGMAKTDAAIINDFATKVQKYNYGIQHRGFAELNGEKIKDMLDKSRTAHGAAATKTISEALRICRIYFDLERTGRGAKDIILKRIK